MDTNDSMPQDADQPAHQTTPPPASEAMAQQVAKTSSAPYATISLGNGKIELGNFGHCVDFAKIMAKSGCAIPKHLRDNPGACLSVIMQALQWGMNPYSVAMETYMASKTDDGVIAYMAKIVAAAVIKCAPIARRPEYRYEGEGGNLTCSVLFTLLDGTTCDYTSPRIADIKPKNSPLWVNDPRQQLGYFSVRACGRRHFPDVLAGVWSPDEFEPARAAANGLAARLAATPKGSEGFSREKVTSEIAALSAPAQRPLAIIDPAGAIEHDYVPVEADTVEF